ncbi:MAG: HAMP domain-containing sensor histidine kinase [Marmoricola sp.]
MPLPRGSLTSRLVLAMTLVAVVATGATWLLAAPLLHGATEDAARSPLARQAELLAQLPSTEMLVRRVERRTDVQDLTLGIVTPAGERRGAGLALSTGQVSSLLAGDPVSVSATLDGVAVLVEARPTRRGGAVVLAASADSIDAAATALRRRLLLALALGLVLALATAVAVGTRLARPLARTADVARRMASGERGLTLPVAGTHEVGDVVRALGSLDQALTASESRQREFLLSVSHELRTPLTAVRGLAEGLADGTIDPAESRAVGQTMVTESQRLEGYIADLLTLARLEAEDFTLDRTRMDLAALAREAGVVWAGRARRAGIEVRLEVPDDPVWLESDPARLRQVLDALADNAVRVCPAGSIVVLAVGRDIETATLEVRDSGPGLTADDLAQAFEPGLLHDRYAATRSGGQGLGLALVDRLVTRLGGTIGAGTAAEGGVAFVVRLPR